MKWDVCVVMYYTVFSKTYLLPQQYYLPIRCCQDFTALLVDVAEKSFYDYNISVYR